MFPSIEYKEAIVDACSKLDFHYLLQDPIPESVEETPVKLVLCKVTRVSHVTGSYYNTDCNYIMYTRRCNGTLQFDTISTDLVKLCLVVPSSVTVIPEIGHTTQYVDLDGNSAMMFISFLQYRCSFEMDVAASYKIKWYINDTLVAEMEPTNSSEDLALRYNVTNDVELGYMIKCGVVKMPMEESSELLSFNFFAGWKVSDKGIELTKGEYVSVDVELIVPIGCTYTVNEQARCIKELLITDPSYTPDVCKGGILAMNADDPSKDSHKVQTLKQVTEWTGNKKDRFKLSTSDVNYDDATVYNLEVSLTDGASIRTRRDVESHTKVSFHCEMFQNMIDISYHVSS
ncbi:uncharacterized protein LOC123527984 [Mercenaria mercenaria]|uniref:uncharacterized protein LOC123527984 n=1 Tax=Mercenaria mercenaria TaxID=6596 RepID=UPI00234F6A14|nr:uncharacterized protein LOC123527984 [Mercenaria mercenaria]